MSSSGKIMTISCQIDFRAIEPKSNSLDFRDNCTDGHTVYAAQRFNQFNLGHHKKWVIDVHVDKCSYVPFAAHFHVCYYQRRKKSSQSLNSV